MFLILCLLCAELIFHDFVVAAALKGDRPNKEYFAALQLGGIFLSHKAEVFLAPPPNQSPSTPPLHKTGDNSHEEDLTNGEICFTMNENCLYVNSLKSGQSGTIVFLNDL